MNPIQQALILQLAKSVLHGLKVFLQKTDFMDVADRILNAVEGMFPEDSLQDQLAETVTGILRDTYGVEDSDPDN